MGEQANENLDLLGDLDRFLAGLPTIPAYPASPDVVHCPTPPHLYGLGQGNTTAHEPWELSPPANSTMSPLNTTDMQCFLMDVNAYLNSAIVQGSSHSDSQIDIVAQAAIEAGIPTDFSGWDTPELLNDKDYQLPLEDILDLKFWEDNNEGPQIGNGNSHSEGSPISHGNERFGLTTPDIIDTVIRLSDTRDSPKPEAGEMDMIGFDKMYEVQTVNQTIDISPASWETTFSPLSEQCGWYDFDSNASSGDPLSLSPQEDDQSPPAEMPTLSPQDLAWLFPSPSPAAQSAIDNNSDYMSDIC